jgi:hypothetical protein
MYSFNLHYFLTVIILFFISIQAEGTPIENSSRTGTSIDVYYIDPKAISGDWKASEYKLTGLGVNDGAEVIRILLLSMGVTFTYERLNDDNWKWVQGETVVGEIPHLEINEQLFNQPTAAFEYLANYGNLGVNSNSNEVNLMIHTYAAHIMQWHKAVFLYYYETNEVSKESKRSDLMTTLPIFFELFNKAVSENEKGFIYGEKLTWVDLICINTLNFIQIAINDDVNLEKYEHLLDLREKVSKFVQTLDIINTSK